MPRPVLPPTPAASTDISGKEGQTFLQTDNSFTLPPSAVGNSKSHQQQAVPPLSPTSPRYAPVQQATSQLQPPHHAQSQPRKRSSTHADGPTFDGSIPPPPSRSRKIIQVEPKEQVRKAQAKEKEKQTEDVDSAGAAAATAAGGKAGGQGGRKKGNGTSAGRKIARKTAHSLIERRRRSKMNEEFGILKDMIPACNGQDMHKLAILQASIEYVRYLKKCVSDLQSGQRPMATSSLAISSDQSESVPPQPAPLSEEAPSDDEMDEDEDEVDDKFQPQFKAPVYRVASLSSGSLSATTSPAFSAQSGYRTFPHADLPSPALGPRESDPFSLRHHSTASFLGRSPAPSNQASPEIPPQSRGSNSEEEDASQALLMLNACDRRTSSTNDSRPDREWAPGGRAMSVQDLLR